MQPLQLGAGDALLFKLGGSLVNPSPSRLFVPYFFQASFVSLFPMANAFLFHFDGCQHCLDSALVTLLKQSVPGQFLDGCYFSLFGSPTSSFHLQNPRQC